jgi:hypothetical protein
VLLLSAFFLRFSERINPKDGIVIIIIKEDGHWIALNTIESRVKTPVGTVLPRLEQWPYPQLCNTTIQGGAVRGRRRKHKERQEC